MLHISGRDSAVRTIGERAAMLSIGLAAVTLTLTGCGVTGGSPSDNAATQTTTTSSASSTSSTATDPSSPSATSTGTDAPTTSPTTTGPTSGPTTAPTATDGPSPTGTESPAPEDSMLRPGMRGPAVEAAQQRLSDLGYWLGKPDGVYGNQTTQAVLAVQKAAGLSRDGILGPRTRKALEDGVRPKIRTTSGSAIEVDLKHQLVLVVIDGKLKYALNTSTGSGQPYTSGGKSYVARTPKGRFTVQRQIDGMRISHLGELWRPKYFTGGYALHGSPSVPGYPASHGCVRLSNAAIDMVWSSGLAPIGRTVWVY